MRKLVFLFILLTLFGCIEQSEVLFPEKAKLKEQLRADSDGDGIIDISNYKFEELRMKGNITLSKIIIIKGIKEKNESIINISLVKLSKSEVAELRELLVDFNSSRESIVIDKKAETACKQTLGLDKFECSDREGCLKACYSPVCYKIAQGAGFQFLDEMQVYANNTRLLDENVNSANGLLDAIEKEPSGDKAYGLLNTLLAIRAEARAIANSDIFNEEIYSACEDIPFDFDSLNGAINKLADRLGVEVVAGKPDKYEVSTYLILSTPNYTGFVANEIKISERVPEEITPDIKGISEVDPPFTEITQERPLILTWRFTDLGSGQNQTKFILYKAITKREIEKDFVEKNILYPQVSIKRVDPTQVPVVKETLDLLSALLTKLSGVFGVYAALGIFMTIFIVLTTRLLWNFVMAIVRIVEVIKERKDWKETLYQWAGYGRSNNMTYILVAVVFLALSFYLLYIMPSKEIKLQEITIYGLGSFFSQEPLKGIGSVVLSLGLLSLYFVAEDLGKGLVLGKRYYIRPLDMLKLRRDKLIERLEVLKHLITGCEILGIDVSTEEEVMELVDLKEIEELLQSEETLHEAKGILERSFALVEHSVNGLEEKKEILENWPIWNKHIKTEIDSKGVVKIDEIAEIPIKWRRWAMARFLEENMKDVMLRGKSELVKVVHEVESKPELSTILDELINTKKIESCAIIGRDGFVVASNIGKESRDVAGAMGARMLRCAEMVSSELHGGKVSRIISESSEGRMITIGSEKIILICLVRSDVEIGFVLLKMEEAMKKIQQIIK